MKSIQCGPTRDELDARVRELRLQAWRRRSVAAIVSAALAASSITPAVALAEPGGWDGGAPSSSASSSDSRGGAIGSDAGATGDGGYLSVETSGYARKSSQPRSSIGSDSSSGGGISSPSDAADAAGPSTLDRVVRRVVGLGELDEHVDRLELAVLAGVVDLLASEAADAAPATSAEPQTGGLDPDSRDSVPDVAPATPDTGSMPAVTAMGDATGYTQDQTTTTTDTASSPQEAADAAPAKSTETGPYEAPVTTAMGDNTGFTETVETPAPEDTTPADPGSLPATTPMGDATGYTLDDVAQPTPAEPAQPAPTTPDATPTGWQASVTAAWGLGGTVGVAHDDEYTSITIGPAEGTGFFGSVGQANAAHQTTPGASVKGGLGFVSGELSVDQTAITGKANLNMPINPGINQTVASYTGKINPDFSVTGYKTEGMSYGMQVGLATTQTVTIAIPNSAFETVANWLGISAQPETGGGW